MIKWLNLKVHIRFYVPRFTPFRGASLNLAISTIVYIRRQRLQKYNNLSLFCNSFIIKSPYKLALWEAGTVNEMKPSRGTRWVPSDVLRGGQEGQLLRVALLWWQWTLASNRVVAEFQCTLLKINFPHHIF